MSGAVEQRMKNRMEWAKQHGELYHPTVEILLLDLAREIDKLRQHAHGQSDLSEFIRQPGRLIG